MNLPCPKPVDPISIESGSYSRKAVIESWVQHLKHEVKLRILDKFSGLERIWVRIAVRLIPYNASFIILYLWPRKNPIHG